VRIGGTDLGLPNVPIEEIALAASAIRTATIFCRAATAGLIYDNVDPLAAP
jgi:hypothetical protein